MYQDIYDRICQNTKKNEDIISSMSNLQPNWWLKIDLQKVDQHAGGKWLIHHTKRRKDNQLQSLKLPCRIRLLNFSSVVAGFFKIKSVCFIVTTIKIANIFCSETIYALSCDGKNMYAFPTQWMGLKLYGKSYTRLQRNQIYIFSSAADIVSGDYPMQNRPLYMSSISVVSANGGIYLNQLAR